MRFTVEQLSAKKEGLQMWGRAYPGVSSGSQFGAGAPRKGPLKEQIDEIIEQQVTWLRNFYPLRPLKLKVQRPDRRQLTLEALP